METPLDDADPFKYVESVEFFQKNKVVEFKSGLNVLYGANGSGKSSLLKIIGTKLAALQGGVSVLNKDWIFENRFKPAMTDALDFASLDVMATHGYILESDGQSIIYVDPRQKVGVRAGQLDDEFFMEGFYNARFKGSTGESTIRALNRVIALLRYESNPELFYAEGKDPLSLAEIKIKAEKAALDLKLAEISAVENRRSRSKNSKWELERAFKDRVVKLRNAAENKIKKGIKEYFPSTLDDRLAKEPLNDVFKAYHNMGLASFIPSIDKGQPTIIIDEPESGLSPIAQSNLWNLLTHPKVTEKYQIIVATHSPFALSENPDYNLIEMSEGYAANNLAIFKNHFGN